MSMSSKSSALPSPLLLSLFLLSLCISGSEGRGSLIDPPARSSMWRSGFKTPINYNDNGLNCGGLVRQWSYNQGRCGVCGDPYDGARDNERGGKYVTGLVARTYTQGQVVKVTVQVTANEGGWFQFYLCPDSDPTTPVSEQCLQKHLLELDNGQTRYFLNPTIVGDVSVQVKLPSDVTCDRCVFRWMWNAGNTWGVDPDGKSCVGCGHQEQFYGCADVRVVARSNGGGSGSEVTPTTIITPPSPTTTTTFTTTGEATTTSTTKPSTATTTATAMPTTSSTTTTPSPPPPPSSSTTPTTTTSSTFKPSPSTTTSKATTAPTTKSPKVSTTTDQSQHTTQRSSYVVRCRAINDWLGIPAFDQWCDINCNDLNICLSKNCLCTI